MMKNKKAMRLLAASWLIAPTILSTQSVFATEEIPQTAESSVVAGSENTSTTETSASSDSQTTETTDSSTDTSGSENTSETEEPPVETTYTLTINPVLSGKIQFTTVEPAAQPLDITAAGTIEGLKQGTKVSYTITPNEGEQIGSVEINGAQEVDYTNHTFVVGTTDLSITGTFDPVPGSSTEESTNPSEETPNTPEPETPQQPNTPDTGNNGSNGSNGNSGNNGNHGNNGNNGNSGNSGNNGNNNSAHPSNPSGSNNNNAGKETAPVNPGNSSSATQPVSPTAPANPAAIENPASGSSDFVVKSPIEAVLPTNTTSVQQAIVREAYKYLGAPYVWGAKGPSTFDCSGLTYYVYMKATGHYIGGWTGEQQYAGTQIPVSQAQPGDLLFWGPSSGVTHHVGIYIGNGQFIHAPQPGDHVRITSISDFTPDFAVRVNIAGLPAANGSLKDSSILDGIGGSFHFTQNQTTDQFLKKIADDAQEIGQKEGIYASVMMAQAILESGSGNSLLSSEPNYNLFGIKGSYKGSSVSFNTLEQDNAGQSYQIRAQFRKYPSYKESLEDYAELIKKGLSHNPDFYKPTWKSETKDYKEATKYLEGRYATDKQYSQKLNAIIDAYDLTKYDEPKKEESSNRTVTNMSRKFNVPIRWNKNSVVPFMTNKDFSSVNPLSESPFYFSGLRVATVWDLWDHFTTRQIPETPTLTVRATAEPIISFLSLDKSFWLELPLMKAKW